MNTLTKYASFEAMKQAINPVALPAAEKERLDVEARQMAEILQAIRAKRRNRNAR